MHPYTVLMVAVIQENDVPSCNSVTIIFINTEQDGWNDDKTILYVKVESLDINWKVAAYFIHKLFQAKNVYAPLSGKV